MVLSVWTGFESKPLKITLSATDAK